MYREMNATEILERLAACKSEKNRRGMARFGINVERAYGVGVTTIRKLRKGLRRDHALAAELWESGVHEARIFACLIDEPARVSDGQMERWALDFDSWDLCDQCCSNLFDKTPCALEKARAWPERDREFVKRAGFVLMCALAVHDKKAPDRIFLDFLPLIERQAHDERNYVKKAVNWALRQIGKRNPALNAAARETAERILAQDAKAARWIARHALRELAGEKILAKFGRRGMPPAAQEPF